MDETLARFFYEQCAGVTPGHMANIPNSPVLFSLCTAYAGTSGITEYQFAEMLRAIADELDRRNGDG